MSNIPKPFAIGLALSVALNLFFLGIWAGRHWSGREPDGYGLNVHGFLRRSGLNDAGPNVQQILHAERSAIRQRMHDMAEARRKVRDALDAEPFDRARLEAALADVQTQTASVQQQMHVTLVKIADSVDAQHRARMANALWPKRGFGRRGP